MAASTAQKSRPALQLTSAYKKVSMSSLKVTDLDSMFQGISSSYNKYTIAISYTNMKLHPAYHEEQMRYLALDYHDINSARETIKLGLKIDQKRCLQAIQSFGDIQGSATFVNPRDDLLYHVTKLKCAYTSFLISQWTEREDINKLVPGIKKIYSDDIDFLEAHGQKPKLGATLGSIPPQNTQTAFPLVGESCPSQEKVVPANPQLPLPSTTGNAYPAQQPSAHEIILEVDPSTTNTTPWSQFRGFDKLDEELASRMILRTNNASGRPYEAMPAPVLLHGLPGVGKRSYVSSFAREYNLPLWVLSLSIYGPAMADSVRVLDKMIDKHYENSTLPAVLLIEDADLFLCEPPLQDSRLRIFQTLLNKTWDRIDARNISVFIFAVTSNPEKLSDAYAQHRLTHSVHVKIPDSTARRELFRDYLLEYPHKVQIGDYFLVCQKSQGHTASNIKKLLKAIHEDLISELYLQAERFSWITYGGSDALVPDNDGSVKGPLHLLPSEVRSKTRVRPITGDMIVRKLDSWKSKTVDAEKELGHGSWQKDLEKRK